MSGDVERRAATWTLLGLIGLIVLVRALYVRDPAALSHGLAPAPAAQAAVSTWDAEHERDVDLRCERRLLHRELLVIALIAGLVVLRLMLVAGG